MARPRWLAASRSIRLLPTIAGAVVTVSSDHCRLGGLAASLVGLGGADNAVPLGLVTVASAALATIAYRTAIRGAATVPQRLSRVDDRSGFEKPRRPVAP